MAQDQHSVWVSIHAPHEGERLIDLVVQDCEQLGFNPRSPRGGATKALAVLKDFKEVSIHAPHEGERLLYGAGITRANIVSIHAPHEGERRGIRSITTVAGWSFNPRSPRGGATAEKCICMQHFREFTEYYPLRHGDACCIAPQDCIIQAFFGAKKRCFYVRLCFALKNKGVRG